MRPGEAYPSGGATSNMLDLWKAMTPSLDVIAPDNYVLDYQNYQGVLPAYRRQDNPLLVPETGGPRFASKAFSVEFIEDKSEDEIARLARDKSSTAKWQFYFMTKPSPAVEQRLADVLG